MNTLVLKSYAKVNLYLEVLRKRSDNYHSLKTLFERIDLHDTVTLASRADTRIRLTCSHPDIPLDESNLVLRSARLLQGYCRVVKGVSIDLAKRIPIGSGMGGGSSNAAAVLVGLNKLWGLKLSVRTLAQLASRIGSDVPFFVFDAPFALGTGRGERIQPLKALAGARFWHVVAVPRLCVSTPQIYSAWDRKKTRKVGLTKPKYNVKILCSALKKENLTLVSLALFNSLQEITQQLYAQVAAVRREFKRSGLSCVLMSGSGPTVFGLAPSRSRAASAARRMQLKNKTWRVYVARTK